MKNNSEKQKIILLAIVILVSFIIGMYLQYSKDRILSEDTKVVPGVFKSRFTSGKTGTRSDFIYKVDKTFYTITESGGYNSLQEGDTVLIKYSVKHPSVGEVIDDNYMRK